ncbi:hypothetical protein [Pseudoxanthomonas mexicana]|uniref:hypothetical protein n=1 Tax=Pseudoxanthomonas mexicana TaxID=128785 RepID=UPI00398A69C7
MNEKWMEEDDIHWAYFLALEEDLYQLSRFVEISEANFSTHSIECTRLLLASCSEAEVVLKLAAGLGKSKSLGNCFELLGDDAEKLVNGKVLVRRAGLEIQPWFGWAASGHPPWWRAHNAVKHDRSRSYTEANLQNALYSLAALFAAVLIYLRRKGVKAVFPAPRLLRASELLGSHCMTPDGAIISLQD